jgi:hypothetical protein
MAGVELQRRHQALQRGVGVAGAPGNLGQRGVQVGRLRMLGQSGIQRAAGFRPLLAADLDLAEVGQGAQIGAIGRRGGGQQAGRAVEVAVLGHPHAEVVGRLRLLGFQAQAVLEGGARRLGLAQLPAGHAEQVVGDGVGRVAGAAGDGLLEQRTRLHGPPALELALAALKLPLAGRRASRRRPAAARPRQRGGDMEKRGT